jgi:hypothetical protein
MERELWSRLYDLAVQLDVPAWKNRGKFATAVIVGVFLWAVVHDRPTLWACDRRNWPSDCEMELPSQSTMSRRLRTQAVEVLLNRMSEVLGESPETWIKSIDAKPLPIGGYSKDTDAGWGYCINNYAYGYKFYAIWGSGPIPEVWGLAPMNFSECRMAQGLISHLRGTGYLLGDALYDSNKLYDLAWKHGHQFVAPRQKPKSGLGSRRQSPHRLRAIELLTKPFGKALHAERDDAERRFAWLTNCGTGLMALPPWVRRPRRVRLWIYGKLLINCVRLSRNKSPLCACNSA